MASGRNDPCPCGSGKKYKKCCLDVALEGATSASTEEDLARAEQWHEHDNVMLAMLAEIGQGFDDWQPSTSFPLDVDAPGMAALFGPWAVYEHREGRGRSMADYFMQMSKQDLSREEKILLKAQTQARLTIWEIVEVDVGRSIRVRDLLREGHERVVTERKGSEAMVAGQGILARVLDLDGISILGGIHPLAIEIAKARGAVRTLREGLMGKADRALDDEVLRRSDFTNLLIEVWNDVLTKELE